MPSVQSHFFFPHYPPPPPSKTPPSPATTPPSPHFVSPPPPSKTPPSPPHFMSPPPPHPAARSPPPPHIVAPPPTPPAARYPPPPPHVVPPPPPSAPGNHSTIIVVLFVSCGGVFFLAFIMAVLWCFLKKKKKRVQKAQNLHVDEHRTVKETVVEGPNGTETVVLSVEDDIHIEEDIRKSEIESFRKGLHLNGTGDTNIEAGEPSSSSGQGHHGYNP